MSPPGANMVNWRWQDSGVVLKGRIEGLVQQESFSLLAASTYLPAFVIVFCF